MTQTITNRPAYILWDISNRKNWEIAAKGTYKECENASMLYFFEESYNVYCSLREAQEAAAHCGISMDRVYSEAIPNMEIHENKIKDSWNNPVEKIHYDTYMDGTTEDRPMTAEEISADDDTDQDGGDGYMGDE